MEYRTIKGFEMELNGVSVTAMQRALRQANLRYVFVERDPSENVDCEVVFPPLRIDTVEECKKHVKPVMDLAESIGARIVTNCGGHVHVGLMPLLNDENSCAPCDRYQSDAVFNQIQVDHWQRNTSPSLSSMQGAYLSPRVHAPNTLLPFELIKCVIKTYGYNQQYISSMLPKSRRNHTWAAPIGDKVNTTNFDHARSIDDLKRVGFTKRSAINVATDYDTIEFRQGASTLNHIKLANWCQVLEHLFQSSSAFRVNLNASTSRTITVNTPMTYGRHGSFINLMYNVCRNENNGYGATIQELMNRFNRGAQNIRSRISEFRRELGHGAIVTHTQQSNGNVYGDGEIYCRYQILHEFNKVTESNGTSLVNNPDYNFFIGLNSDLKRWIDRRIYQLA